MWDGRAFCALGNSRERTGSLNFSLYVRRYIYSTKTRSHADLRMVGHITLVHETLLRARNSFTGALLFHSRFDRRPQQRWTFCCKLRWIAYVSEGSRINSTILSGFVQREWEDKNMERYFAILEKRARDSFKNNFFFYNSSAFLNSIERFFHFLMYCIFEFIKVGWYFV